MIPFTLHITLLSPTAPGSGDGRAGVVDREIVSDSLGLPLIPARRLKGALLEAARDTQDALAAFPAWQMQNLLAPVEIFGSTGQNAPGPFLLGDANLEAYQDLRQWVRKYSETGGEAYFHPEAVLTSFTEQRTQTSIDMETGGPLENTLRVTRLLRKGLQFTAFGELYIADQQKTQMALRTLSLACYALRRLGMSRNRGSGEVRIRLKCAQLTWTPDQLTQELIAA